MPQRTALYDRHVALAGRMVDFAGWELPVQYTSIVDEHHAVRQSAGLFDISHMGRITFMGNDVLTLLEQIDTNDVAGIRAGQVRYGLVCNDQGGVRDDVLVYRLDAWYSLVVNASNRDKILAWLEESREGLDVQIHDQTLNTCMIALQGPRSVELCQSLLPADISKLAYYHVLTTQFAGLPCIASRTGYTGEDGLEFIVPTEQGPALWDELVRRGARPCGLGARDTLRLEAGMPLYGHELSEEIDPLQAGLSWAVKLDKPTFRGRAALAQRKLDVTRPHRVGLQLNGRRIAREGAEVRADGKKIGVVTSGTFSPTLQHPIAMAYVDPLYTKLGLSVKIDVRGTEEDAIIAALPFYRRPKPGAMDETRIKHG